MNKKTCRFESCHPDFLNSLGNLVKQGFPRPFLFVGKPFLGQI